MVALVLAVGRRGRPSLGFVASGRVLQQEGSNHGHDQENSAQDLERGVHAISRNEVQIGKRPEERRTGSISADRQSHGQTALVGKPLRHDRNGCGVAEAVAQSADHAEAHEQVHQAMGERTQEEAQAHQYCAGERYPEGAELVLQPASDNEGQGEHHDRDGKHHGGVGALPSKLLLQRRHKDAPRIERAQGNVHHQSADDTPPTVQPDAANLNRINACCCSCGHLISPFLTRKHVTIAVSCEQ